VKWEEGNRTILQNKSDLKNCFDICFMQLILVLHLGSVTLNVAPYAGFDMAASSIIL
jgi:hypothetical protein